MQNPKGYIHAAALLFLMNEAGRTVVSGRTCLEGLKFQISEKQGGQFTFYLFFIFFKTFLHHSWCNGETKYKSSKKNKLYK